MQCSFHKYLLRTDYDLRFMLDVMDDKAIDLRGTHYQTIRKRLFVNKSAIYHAPQDNSMFNRSLKLNLLLSLYNQGQMKKPRLFSNGF